MSRCFVVAILLVLAGCAGSPGPKSVAKTDLRYCESLGLTVGSDPYAECRLRQMQGSGEPGS